MPQLKPIKEANTVAEADEFKAIQNESGWVDIFDGEGSIRLTMPYDVWEQFTGDAVAKRVKT